MHSKSYVVLLTMFMLAVTISSSGVRAGSMATTGIVASPVPTLELLGRWNDGPVYSSVVSGNYMYFGKGGGIRVVKFVL